jgi:hypothetical protein
VKLNRNQLKRVKTALKNSNDNYEEDSSPKTSIADVKRALKALSEDDSIDKTSSNKRKIKNAKKEARKTKSVEIKWNIGVGDMVSFKLNDKETIGLIIEDYSSGTFQSKYEARYRGQVLVLSPAGRQWFRPSALEKINED